MAEHDGATGALIREYFWLDDMPLALVSGSVSSPTYSYVHTGQIGEPLMVTDASNAVVWDAAIDPWGKPVMLSTASVPLDLHLPGQWYQETARLHQNWMRDYDPVLGAYIQADPLGIQAGQNLYGYVDGNPLRYADPEGLQRATPMPGSMPPLFPGFSQPDKNGNGFGDWDEQGAKKLRDFLTGCAQALGKLAGGGERSRCEEVIKHCKKNLY